MATKDLEQKFFIVAGASGVGKRTIINEVLGRRDLTLVKSYTSRPAEDRNYLESNFFALQRSAFEEKIAKDQMLEYDHVHGDYMGLGKDVVNEALNENKSMIKDLTTTGYLNCKEKLKDQVGVVGIWLTAKKSDIVTRLKMRGEQNVKLRLKDYSKNERDMTFFDYVINNYNKDKTVYMVEQIIDFETKKNVAIPLLDPAKFNIKKLDKYVGMLAANKKLKPVKAIMHNGSVVIVEGEYRYLAGLKHGTSVCKKIEEKSVELPDLTTHAKEWTRIIKNLTK